MSFYKGKIDLNKDDKKSLMNAEKEILESKRRKRLIEKEIICRYKLPVGKLCFIYHKDYYKHCEFTNVSLVWLDAWKIFNGIAFPFFKNLTKDGKPSDINHLTVDEFEVYDGTFENARKILKDAKKTVTQEKKEIDARYAVSEPRKTYKSFTVNGMQFGFEITEIGMRNDQPIKMTVGCTEKGPEQPPFKTTPRGFVELCKQKELTENENK